MELIKILTEQLGVSQDQAQGGAGLLFKLAKDKMSSDEFSQVAGHVPGLENLVESAPDSGMLGSALSGLASSLSGGETGPGGLAGLVGGFTKLGLDSDMIGKFVPIIMNYLKDKGGESLAGIISNALN